MNSCHRVSHTIILDDPFDDPKGLAIPDRSPEPTQDQLDVGYLILFCCFIELLIKNIIPN